MGNLYVAESDRAGNAVQDTRNLGKLHAVEEDLQFKSVEDRAAQIHRWIKDGAFPPDYFTKTEDRVRVVWDSTGAGVADKSKVFAGGFNQELDGIGAGVMWYNGTLYYTCIPNLWAMKDTTGNREASERKSLAYGFGVRWCFYGHDLHGLTMGPDGRVYFSMGDRGFNVTTKEGVNIVGVDRGGVFRCWPDGSELELFYQGLRNPQELAFNDLGDLFTGDNNCDSGDLARVVHVAEGGDSGWRQDVQSLDSRGPWNREAIWKTLKDVSGPARPAWTLPPMEYVGAGPSGIAFYPGVGESHSYDGCIFMVDFYGSGSTVHSFRAAPDGAGFTLKDHTEYYHGVTITDIAWGYDSKLYMSDWGGGWEPNANGNVLVVSNNTVRADAGETAAINEVATLFKAGFESKSDAELAAMLKHRDQRVRFAAQYQLASRGAKEVEIIRAIATDKAAPIVGRAHAIWTLGQIARSSRDVVDAITPLLDDPDAEIRTQATRTVGDLKPDASRSLAPKFVAMLKDPSTRARAAAAIALSKAHDAGIVMPVLQMLAENDNKDLVLRHAGALALAKACKPADIAAAAQGMNPAARLAAVIALRRAESELAGAFLTDADPAVAIESARAIYDLRIASALPILAALLDRPVPLDRAIEPLMRRAIEANVLLGTDECADRLAAFAAQHDAGATWKSLALERLEGWDKKLAREGVWGNWADLPARPTSAIEHAVVSHIDGIIAASGSDEKLLARAYKLQVKHALHVPAADMVSQVLDTNRPADYRLALLDQIPGDKARDLATKLLAPEGQAHGALRRRAIDMAVKADAQHAVELLVREASTGETRDRQHAVRALGNLKNDDARNAVTSLIQDMQLGLVDRSIALELYEAAKSLPKESPAYEYAQSLGKQGSRPDGYATRLLASGGDPDAGRELFLHHPSAECVRCHTVSGLGGTAGPNLTLVATRQSVGGLVESVVEPAAQIAPGFGNVSAMPKMTDFLSPREVRNVVAYLATLNGSHDHGAEASHHEDTRTPGSPLRPIAFVFMAIVGVVTLRGWTRRD